MFLGTTVNAAYGIANQVNTAVNSFVQNFITAMKPPIIKSYAANNLSYMISLIFRGTKFSYYLLLFFAIPLIFEMDYVLKGWLGIVPEYTVIFTRLVLINSLLESFTYVIGTSIQATGKIKWYQIIVGGAILLNLPVSYLVLKWGYTPYVVFIVSIIISMVTLLLRLFILKKYIYFSIAQFCTHVFGRVSIVTTVACIVPGLLKYYLPSGWMESSLIIIAGFISVLLTTIFLGLTPTEKYYMSHILKQRL
jgi:O-antigen/teichoic acid export membrane protein